MEQYINEDTIIKNDKYESFKEYIICPICKCLMIEPVICLSCQNNYCKNCIESWKKKGGSCPNKCENPIFKNVIGKNRLISKFNFKCIKGCGAEIPFDDINTHYNSNCLNNISNTAQIETPKNEKSKMTMLTNEQAAELKGDKSLPHMSSKINKLIKFYSNNIGRY